MQKRDEKYPKLISKLSGFAKKKKKVFSGMKIQIFLSNSYFHFPS
jgi:hypothetical protein